VAVAAVVAVAVLAILLVHHGRGSSTVDLVVAADPGRSGSSSPASPPGATSPTTPTARPAAPSAAPAASSTTAPTTRPAPTTSSAPRRPEIPTLSVRPTRSGRIRIEIGNVRAPDGVASVRLLGGPHVVQFPVGSGTTYVTGLAGLAPGVGYTFVARVCGAGGLCSDSAGVPYGSPTASAPELGSGRLSQAGRRTLRLVWDPVRGTVPADTGCRVVIWSTSGRRAGYAVGLGPVDLQVAVSGGGGYWATKTCTWPAGSVSAESNRVRLW
jgi:hypothetical protein